MLDSSVQIGALLSRHEKSANKAVLRGATRGDFTPIMSSYIQAEIIKSLSLERLGQWPAATVLDALGPLWDRCYWVDLVDDDPAYLRAVRDRGDAGIIRTAASALIDPRLADADERFIVTNNTKDFKGSNWGPFEIVTAFDFWRRLTS